MRTVPPGPAHPRRTPGRTLRRRLPSVAAALALVAAALTVGSPAQAAAPARVPVIVQLVDGADAALQGRLAAADGGRVDHVYRAAISGFAAELTPRAIEKLQRDPRVLSVEPDGVVTATASTTVWGLDRVDQRSLPLDAQYTGPHDGRNVTAYVVDSGIAPHPEFGTRLGAGWTAFADGRGTGDCNGHGTHVAGTVGGSVHGVAPGVALVPVRVLDCQGSGTVSGIIAGLDWVVAHHQAGVPAVANLSLGGPRSSSMDAAVSRVVKDGVTVAVAAGNSGTNACRTSPARVAAALTTGATDATDRRAAFSNVGSCLDLFAPGVDIASTWSDGGVRSISGTSMAAPHVAGAAAVVLGGKPSLTPAQVAATLTSAATTGVVVSAGAKSPNRLLFVG